MKLLVFDATRKPSLLDETWALGSVSMWMRKRMDGFLGATSWEEVFDWLKTKKNIEELQFWGHGTPGAVYIDGQELWSKILSHSVDYKSVTSNFNSNSLIWFRTCSTFHGLIGQEFAKEMSRIFNGSTIAGHTFKIALFHSGLHTHNFKKSSFSWKPEEGKDGNSTQWSRFYKPNTIFCLRNTIPSGY